MLSVRTVLTTSSKAAKVAVAVVSAVLHTHVVHRAQGVVAGVLRYQVRVFFAKVIASD
jgi:hypothetical protein